MLGWLSGRLKNRDYFEVKDVQDFANETPSSLSYTTLILSREKMRNWKSFLDPHIKAVHGISKYHHFKIQQSDGDPTVHAKAWSSDDSWKQLHVLRKSFSEQNFPPLLPFKRLSPEKLKDLLSLAQLIPGGFLSYATNTPPEWSPWESSLIQSILGFFLGSFMPLYPFGLGSSEPKLFLGPFFIAQKMKGPIPKGAKKKNHVQFVIASRPQMGKNATTCAGLRYV